jgi:outer membrane protein
MERMPAAREDRYNEAMNKIAVFVLGIAWLARAEIRPLTLRQAVSLALRQNPDVMLARLDAEKARQAIRVVRDPFTPRLSVGSGLAYSDGFPMSIDGSAPSIVQARASQFLFNRQQTLAVAQAKEDARAAMFTANSKRDEVAYRVATLFLDAERATRVGELARRDVDSRQKVLETVQALLQEGRALPLDEKTAALHAAQARQIAANLEDDQIADETALALALGYPAEDRVRPVEDERAAPPLPVSEEQALQDAIDSNQNLRRLESQIMSKRIELRGAKAARWPHADLVAQYGMLAKFNNYDQFFKTFQRNNGEIGVSFQLPLISGSGVRGQTAQSEIDIAHLELEYKDARNRLASDLQQAFRSSRRASTAAEVARLDLDVAREQLSVDLAQMQEGRLPLRQIEEARIAENEKWIAFDDAQFALEKARWDVLRLTGALVGELGAQ